MKNPGLTQNRIREVLVILVLFLVLLCSSAQMVYSAPVEIVTTLNDSGAGSLRQAIADVDPGGIINITVTGIITLTTGQLIINNKNMTINGPVQSIAVTSGNSRIFLIIDSTVSISDLTMQDASAFNTFGGGVGSFDSDVTLTNVTIRNNTITGLNTRGGGINNDNGTMTLINVTISNNTASANAAAAATSYGGGIYNNGGTMTLTNVTVSNNIASSSGGSLSLAFGGGIYNNGGTMTLTNVTINGNSTTATGSPATNLAGGIFNASITLSLLNTIISNNLPEDCVGGPITSSGWNIDSDNTCGLTNPGDQPGIDPMLGPLQNNGGPTLTHALLAGSPAIDRGDNTGCPASDQRGRTRPADGDLNGTFICDIGAFELITTPAPAMNEWGMLIFMALAGIGSVYYLSTGTCLS